MLMLSNNRDDFSLALGHICASLPDNIKVLFAHHYLVVIKSVITSVYLQGNKVDGETLGSLILALFIGCTHLDPSGLDLIMFMISLQYSYVENSLRLSVYQYKLVT